MVRFPFPTGLKIAGDMLENIKELRAVVTQNASDMKLMHAANRRGRTSVNEVSRVESKRTPRKSAPVHTAIRKTAAKRSA